MSVMAVVRLNAHPGKGGAIREMLNDGGMLETARRAEGCVKLEVFVGEGNPDAIAVLEEWTSIEAHDRYLETVGDSFDALMELVAERDAHHYQAID